MGFRPKKLLPLGNLGGQEKFYCCATDINDAKQIIGLSEVNIKKYGHYGYHAFLWDKAVMYDLGALEQDQDSIAYAINSRGDVVGSCGNKRAFIWTKQEGMIDLNSLISSDNGWEILEAVDINDNGEIVCWATLNGERHVILLTPI